MSDLKTLRGLSGLSPEPASLKKAALVLIDIQNTYREGVMRLSGVEPAVAEAAILLKRARESGVPVFHIRHNAGPGSPYDITAEIGQISTEVAPQGGEAVITKAYPSSFVGTDLRGSAQAGRRHRPHPGRLHDPYVRQLDGALAPSTSASVPPSSPRRPRRAICRRPTARWCRRPSYRPRASRASATCSP